MKYFLQFTLYIMLASGMLSLLCILSFYNLLTSQNTRIHMNHSVSIVHLYYCLIHTFFVDRIIPTRSLEASWPL